MSKRFVILGVLAAALVGFVLVLRFSPFGTNAIWQLSGGGTQFLPLVIVAALIDSVNPCAFSILLLTIAFLFSLGRVRKDVLAIGLVYVAGLFTVYILIGLGILQALHIFNTPHFMGKVGASLLILLGLVSMIGEFFPKFPIRLKIPAFTHAAMARLMGKGTLPAMFVLGVLVGLCEFPCTGGPYLMILGLLHDTGTYVGGFGYLLLYNLLFVMPLVIILMIAADKALLEKVQAWKKTNTRGMRVWGGAAVIVLGFLMFLL